MANKDFVDEGGELLFAIKSGTHEEMVFAVQKKLNDCKGFNGRGISSIIDSDKRDGTAIFWEKDGALFVTFSLKDFSFYRESLMARARREF